MYAKTRPETEFADLPDVKKNRKAFLEHFGQLGIEEVIEAEDSREQYREGLERLRVKAFEAHKSKGKIKLFIYVYYSGHGIMYGGATML